MKQYDVTAKPLGDDVSITPIEAPCGQWVPASVAQALYDALVNLRREAKLIQFDVVDNGIDDAIYGAKDALSLADGEAE